MSDFVATDGLKTQEPNQPSSGCLPLSFQNSEEIPEPLTLTLAPPAPSDDSSRSPLARRINVVPSDSTSANPIPMPKATIPSDRRPKQPRSSPASSEARPSSPTARRTSVSDREATRIPVASTLSLASSGGRLTSRSIDRFRLSFQ